MSRRLLVRWIPLSGAPGESLSSFVQDAVSRAIEYRKAQQAFLIEDDPMAAARAVDAIETAFELLDYPPFSRRKDSPGDRPLLRELLIPVGNEGYVAPFEIDDSRHASILAVRPQREEDCH